MQRVFNLSRLCYALGACCVALGAGCVAPSGDESFIVRQNLAPTDLTMCSFLADIASPTLARGQLHLDSPVPYFVNPLFESRIVAADGKESLRTILLQGANIELVI